MVSIGAAVTLIAAGGILRFAVATTSTHALNVHVVGLILILAGLLGLVLSLLIWVLLNRRGNRPVGDSRAAPPLTPQRFPQDQPPATDDRRVYQDQPPTATPADRTPEPTPRG
jgi:hypothetical protein